MSENSIVAVRVENVRVSPRTLWRHVLLTTRDGCIGIGEATLATAPADMDRRLERAGAALVGKPARASSLTTLAALLAGDMTDATIYSALEQAVTDLYARQAGVSCYRLLREGATAAPIALYANINRRTESRRPEAFAANARAAADEGFTAIKLAPFDGLTPERCTTPEGRDLIDAGLARIAAVADAVSGRAEIQVDCHWRFSQPAARTLVDELAALGVGWLECPLPEETHNIAALAELRGLANAAGMRMAGLENFCTWQRFEPYAVGGCYDVIMPDIKHCGGYVAMLEIAARASEFGVSVSPHNPSGPICHQASVHAAIAIASEERLEMQWRESPLFERITTPAANFAGGLSRIDELPGLGMHLHAPDQPSL